jgi:hypothetical protein
MRMGLLWVVITIASFMRRIQDVLYTVDLTLQDA